MSTSFDPQLTIAQAGPVLEQEFRQRFGNEFDKLYRTLALQAEEHTTNEEEQVLGIIALIGKTNDQTNLFLALMWLAKKEAHDSLAREMLKITRQKSVQQLVQEARKAVRDTPRENTAL